MISPKQSRKMVRRAVKRWLIDGRFVTHNGVDLGSCEWAPPHYDQIRTRFVRRPRVTMAYAISYKHGAAIPPHLLVPLRACMTSNARHIVATVLRLDGPATLTQLRERTRLSRLRLRIALWRLERAGLVVARKGVPTAEQVAKLLAGVGQRVEFVYEVAGGEHGRG